VNASTTLSAKTNKLSVQAAWLHKESLNGYAVEVIRSYRNLGPKYPLDSDTSEAVDNDAIIKAAGRLKPALQGLVVLGEMRETLHLIKHPALGIRKAIEKYRHRQIKRRKKYKSRSRYRDDAADAWLEFQFGIRPLISDVKDGYEAYRSIVEHPRYIKFGGGSTGDLKSGGTFNVYPYSFVTNAPWLGEHESHTMYEARYIGEYALIPYSAHSFVRNLGVGFDQVIPAGWELMPWSFLIDYFSNIGDVLSAVANISATDFTWVNATHRRISRSRVSVVPRVNESWRINGSANGVADHYQKVVSRSPLHSLPRPRFEWGGVLSSSQGLNIAALAQGREADRRYRR
jgi:hypothetical protein